MGKQLNVGLFCWGLDAKWQKGVSFHWRMYVTEGSLNAGGININEADVGGAQLMGWLYGNKKAVSIMVNKIYAKKIKLGVRAQFRVDKEIDSFLKNCPKDMVLSSNVAFLF